MQKYQLWPHIPGVGAGLSLSLGRVIITEMAIFFGILFAFFTKLLCLLSLLFYPFLWYWLVATAQMHPSDDCKLLRCTHLDINLVSKFFALYIYNVMLIFFSDLCCIDAPIWWEQIFEMRPSWHVVSFMCSVVFLFWFSFPTFAVWMST